MATKTTETYRFRIEGELLRRALKEAGRQQRTLASLIRFLLVEYLNGRAIQKAQS